MGSKFDVVISGISGRFPECDDVDTFKEKLYNQEDFFTVDDRKWPVGYKYKFLSIPDSMAKYTKVGEVDQAVFKMNSLFKNSTDVRNRLILEPAFEAIVDAGINPYSLDGQNIGVFTSTGINDMENKMFQDNGNDRFLSLIGCSQTMLANRISFAFNLTGPSLTLYTDILGGLEALAFGYKYVSEGFVDAAVVGTSSNIIEPKISLNLKLLGLLSPDAVSRVFGKQANGYSRSESTVVFYLQKAEDAKRNYGTLKFCDTLHFGLNPSTLLGYDEDCIKMSLRNIHESYNYTEKANRISFVEMSATGIKRLDKIESNAVAEIFCKNRKEPLLIGSVKSNIGNTETASGLMSVLKALFALDSGYIVSNLNVLSLNDEIVPLKTGKLKVVEETTELKGNTVAVNSIGLYGSVGHAVIEQNSIECKESSFDEKFPRLLLICGRNEKDLREKITQIEALPFNKEFIALSNDAFIPYMPHHLHRGFTILPKPFKAVHAVEERGDKNRPIWFVFTGMGCQWNNMGVGLLDIPIFSNIVTKCDEVLRPKGINIYEILTSEDPAIFDNIIHSFVGIITVQIGLVEILKALNIKPDGIIGHSVGENACAYADGCLTLEEAVLSSYARGVASTEVETERGMMAAIGKGYNQIKDNLPKNIEVACHNSAESCTLTGPAEDVNNFVSQLQSNGIFAKAVNVANIAYHSKYIAPAGPKLLSRLKEVIKSPKERSSKWISTSIAESQWNTELAKSCTPEYLTNNLLNSVLFEEGSTHIPQHAIVIEIAPHGLLQSILKRSLHPTCTNIPLLSRTKTKENVNCLLSAIGKLYIAGCEPCVNNLYPRIDYPVPRGTPPVSPYCTWHHPPNLNTRYLTAVPEPDVSTDYLTISIKYDSEYYYLRHHKIKNEIVIPPSLFIYLSWYIFSFQRNEKIGASSVIFENIKFFDHLSISIRNSISVSIMIQKGTGDFEIVLENQSNPADLKILVSGRIKTFSDNSQLQLNSEMSKALNCKVKRDEFYETLKNEGYLLDDCFKLLEEICFNEKESMAKILWNGNWITFLDALIKYQMYFQVNAKSNLLCPSFIRRLAIDCAKFDSMKKDSSVLIHNDLRTGNLQCDGVEMNGLKCSKLNSKQFNFDRSTITLRELRFVSHMNPNCQNEYEFVNLCLQLAVENLYLMTRTNTTKLYTYVTKTTNRLMELIEKVVKDVHILKARVILCGTKEKFSKHLLGDNKYTFLVINTMNELNMADTNSAFILVVFPLTEAANSELENSFLLITRYIFSGKVYCLFKKKSAINSHLTCVPKDSENGHLTDVSKDDEKIDSVCVIRKNVEASDLTLITSNQKKYEYSKIRYLFLMDEELKPRNTTNILLQQQLIQDLSITVLKNGDWGSYRNISSPNVTDINGQPKLKKIFLANFRLESVHIHFFCTDPTDNNDYELNHKDQNYGIEYSGIDTFGKKIMGLTSISNIDPVLFWQVPDEWTLEEAATVPLIYAQAYYIFVLTDGIGSTSSVFINAGNEMLLTEACIAIFLNNKFSVYVAVSNDKNATEIKRYFPELEDFRILRQDKCQYEQQLMKLTNRKGVDIVINCASGTGHIQASINCAGEMSQYVEIGKNNCNDLQTLGLDAFLKIVTFSILPNEINFLLQLPVGEKITLQKLIDEGIKCGVVVPFPRTRTTSGIWRNDSLRMQNIKYVPECTSEKQTKNMESKVIQCNENNSYIIVGGRQDGYSWINLVKWLINKGASKFVINVDGFSIKPRLSYQLNRILKMKKGIILLPSSHNLNVLRDATQFVAEANKLAPLAAVYFISVESASRKIRNMDIASRVTNTNVTFISLFSGGLKELESRQREGLPSVVIHSEVESNNLSKILSEVETHWTRRNENNNSCILYEVTDEKCLQGNEKKLILADYLPKDLKCIEQIGYDLTEMAVFKERTSLSAPYSETRGVYPIFVVPGVHGTQLDPLIRKLFYPVFCATLSESTSSIAIVATELYQHLNCIQPLGPVTLIGETFSAMIAIELASLIKHTGRKVKLFLLEGDPIEWKEQITALDTTKRRDFMENVFCFDTKFAWDAELNTFSLERQSRTCASMSSNLNFESIIKALNSLRMRLCSIPEYELSDELLENVTLFTQHFPENFSCRLSVSSEICVLQEDSHQNFIQNLDIIYTINNNALYEWWNNTDTQI